MVIPKRHLSCVGEYSSDLFDEFEAIYARCAAFVQANFGPPAAFEHGILGQTVFHSHVHLLPFSGTMADLVPEGELHYYPLKSLAALRDLYRDQEGYLFASVGGELWTVDSDLAAPRFFRDRFAKALGRSERGNWKTMHEDEQTMQAVRDENKAVQALWSRWSESVDPSSGVG